MNTEPMVRGVGGDEDGQVMLERSGLVRRVLAPDRAPVVTSVVAPAGYGKTALLEGVARAADEVGIPTLMLSMEDCEHHPGLFVDMLVGAVRRSLPGADLRPLLMLKKAAPREEYAERLPHVLERVLEPVGAAGATLLVDDVHHATAGEALVGLLRGLLRSEPTRLRFVFASRRTLPLDLAPHRERGELLELTGADLAFSLSEVRAFLEGTLGRDVRESVAERVWQRTRGWPGVLSLIATMMSDRSDEELAGLVTEISGEEQAIVDFVVDRLLSEYSPPLRYFIKVVSVLDHIDHASVEALFADAPRRTRRTSGRYFISLPGDDVPDHLQRMEWTQVLLPSDCEDARLELNPLVRDALRKLLAREDPRVFREAHRRAADHYLRDGEVDDASLDHLVAAGDFDRVLDLLEGEAERFFTSGYHRQLSHWLLSLEAHYASLPFWACYYVGRIYAGMGEWDRARSYLDRCKGLLGERRKAGDLWRWQPRLCLGNAAMYWRRGMHAEASTYCRRGLDFLRQIRRRGELPEAHRSEAAGVQLDLLNLLGTIKMDSGSYDGAWKVCEEARDIAEEEGRSREEALALKNLGLIATRRGAIPEATAYLERALVRADAETDPELHASIAYVLGLDHRMTGRYQAALDLIEEALPKVQDAGRPETIATMLATLGEVHGSLGHGEEAEHAFRRAMGLLDKVADAKVEVEVLDRYVIYLARRGRVEEAGQIQERASGLVDGHIRDEVHVVALHSEALAEWCAACGRRGRALAHLQSAGERYARVGAPFHVARLAWRRALLEHAQFAEGEEESPERVMAALKEACEIAGGQGYHFEIGAEHRELLHVGAAYGEEPVGPCCREALEALDGRPLDPDAPPELSEEALARYQDYRRRAELADEYLITTRRARHGANARQVEELLRDEGQRELVVIVHADRMVNRGKEVSLSEKRVILPLLLHFLRHPDEPFTMDRLAESVWQSQTGKSSMQTKVKVAISRLRALLGKERKYIVTARVPKPSGGGTQVAYGLAPDLDYYLVDRLDPSAEEGEEDEADAA